MNRDTIITTLTELLKPEESVHALWLEGSDATRRLDEYSDIDICICVDEGSVDEVFQKIQETFTTDYVHINYDDSERQMVFHVVGTNKYLMVDFNAYFYGKANTTFVTGDTIDVCKVLFDKKEIIQYKDYDPTEGAGDCDYWKSESEYLFSQLCRVEKYCLRGLYPEAFVYYQKYVVTPLVFTLRRKYTPTKIGYYMVHISDHIPQEEVKKLNRVLQVSGVDDILANLTFAEEWYKELTKE
ncbi:MAG: nucleotidyltransferase domain-containing protein [Lachnospiraceae bacterium]|nr:nucleotidyltransferase domain-containing protein [Lachnospiraceae bacterium]